MPLTITVSSPCLGNQTVTEVIPQLYQGSTGNFTFAVLSSHPTYTWQLIIYDYADPSSPCYPNAVYGQVTPNASDPTGLYGLQVNGQGTPDPSAGSAAVA